MEGKKQKQEKRERGDSRVYPSQRVTKVLDTYCRKQDEPKRDRDVSGVYLSLFRCCVSPPPFGTLLADREALLLPRMVKVRASLASALRALVLFSIVA